MLRRLLPALCRRVTRTAAVQKQEKRTSTYFCFDTAMPVIPACYWSTLPNGIRVITEQTANPMACVALFAEAGSRYETACNNGACHFFELMSVRGLCTLNRCQFQEYIREIGGHLDIYTGREYQVFFCRCPHEAVYPVINLFSRLFYELECSENEVICAKDDVIMKFNEIDKDYKRLCYDYLHQTAFQGTTMARTPEGPMKNYERFDAAFLKAFVAQHYQPFRLVFSVSSIHSHNDVACAIQGELGCMKTTTNDLVYWPCRYTGSMIRFRDDSLPYCHIAIGVEVGGYNSPDFVGLQMMKHYIGRWDESQYQKYNTWPMLAHACAIAKLCHRYESFYIPYRDIGLWGIYFVMRKEDDYEDAILMIQDQWMNMCNNLTTPDKQRALESLKLEMAQSVDGCVSTCLDMGKQMLYNGCRLNLLELFEKAESWTWETNLKDLAYKTIYDRCCVVSAVGPTEGVPDYNRTRSGMYWLRF